MNIAHGQIIATGAFITYALDRVGRASPSALAFFLSMIITFFLAMSVERMFLRRLIGEPIISVIMVTIGLMSILDGIDLPDAVWNATTSRFPNFFRRRRSVWAVFPSPGPNWWG